MTIGLFNNSLNKVLVGAQVNDIYPPGMLNAAGNPVVSDTCNFSEDVPANGAWAKLANGTIAANGNCSIVINVVGTSTLTNQTGAVPSGNAHTGGSVSATLTVNGSVADLTLNKSHAGNFMQGQIGATYTLVANNAGSAPTSGVVTVSDTLPASMTATAIGGTPGSGWNCVLGTPSSSCTRSDPLAAGTSYPPITLTVNVAAGAPPSVTNTANVSGGGETNTNNDVASDPTSIDSGGGGAGPDLTLSKSHAGNFSQAQTGAVYSLIAHNIGSGATSGTVTVTDTLPASLTATDMSGPGWNCTPATLSCTRGDPLAAGASYPAITLTVDVAASAPPTVTNAASVSGGGETDVSNDSASDPTTIDGASLGPDMSLTKNHAGNFSQGQTGAVYSLIAHNVGGAATSGTVTVADTLPPSMTATDMSGPGWTCSTATTSCTRTDALAAGSSYSAITLKVDVAASAPPSAVNVASASGGGETNVNNDPANDPTSIDGASAGPDLTLTKSHSGDFSQGQTAAVYTLTAHNVGGAATSGVVTVTDTLPSSLTATQMSGTGWTCPPGTTSCTRNDPLPSGASYPDITLQVDVAANAPPVVTNVATVSGGAETNINNDPANDPTSITGVIVGPDLTLTKSHVGDFTQGQVGATYTLTVHNGGGAATSGVVSVTDTLPPSLTATSMSGNGWTCAPGMTTCTRSNALAGGASYADITLVVNVAPNAPATATNTASVSGGGETNTSNDGASDLTTIQSNGGNHAPVAVGDAAQVTPNGTTGDIVGDAKVVDSLLDNDVDADAPVGDTLKAIKVSDPIHGTLLQFNADGTFVYKNTSSASSDVFTYKACDSHNTCSAETKVTVTIGNALNNHLPFATDDAIEVVPGNSAVDLVGDPNTTDSVLDNDIDFDGDTLTATKLTDPTYGNLQQFNANGTFKYQNTDPSKSTDSFLYQACDGFGACDLGVVSITIGNGLMDSPPIVVDDAIQVTPNPPGNASSDLIGDLNVTDSVLDNDSDPDLADVLTATKMSGLLNASGTLTFHADGTFSYQNTDPSISTDSFFYEACDTSMVCMPGIVSISITNNPLDSLPIPMDDAILVAPNGTASTLVGNPNVPSSVLDNDSDPNDAHSTLKAHLISAPTNGHVDLNLDGTFTYVNSDPIADAFQYEVCDPAGGCVAATVSVTINQQAPTVSCVLPKQVDVVGDAVSIDLSLLFTPPAGQSLSYGATNPPPALSILGSLLSGTLTTSGTFTSALNATTVPGGASASENVIFEVLPAGDMLLRDGFDTGTTSPPCQ